MNKPNMLCQCLISGVLILTLFPFSACKKSNPVQPEESYPERSVYSLVVESRVDPGSLALFTVKANGVDLMKLPSPNEMSTQALVSPNGQYVSFRPGTDYMSLYLYSFATGQSTPLLNDRNWDTYAWAPTSDGIVYCGDKTNGHFVIKTVTLGSGEITALTDSVIGSDRYPHWLPDGNAIAYMHYDSINTLRTLYCYDLVGNQIRKLVPGERATWSPDGSMFFASEVVYSWPTLDTLRDLSSISPGEETFARWFPNSRDLLVEISVSDDGIYKVDTFTGAAQKIISGLITIGAISISADGKLIAFIPGGSGNIHVVVTDSVGTHQQALTLPISGPAYYSVQFIGDVAW